MLFIILAILSFVCAYGIVNEGFSGYWLGFIDWLMLIFLGALGVLLSAGIVVLLSFIPETEPKFKETIEITALKDNSELHGSFYLGSGSIDEETYYYFMTETNKGKKMDKVSTKDAYLNEGETENTYIEVYDLVFTNSIAKFLFGESSGYDEYIFYIPENSVTTEFNVDME